jgi:hypothetical protein
MGESTGTISVMEPLVTAVGRLNQKERALVARLTTGENNQQIGAALAISRGDVQRSISRIFHAHFSPLIPDYVRRPRMASAYALHPDEFPLPFTGRVDTRQEICADLATHPDDLDALAMLAAGGNQDVMRQRLGHLSTNAMAQLVRRVRDILGVDNTAQAGIWAIRRGVLTINDLDAAIAKGITQTPVVARE